MGSVHIPIKMVDGSTTNGSETAWTVDDCRKTPGLFFTVADTVARAFMFHASAFVFHASAFVFTPTHSRFTLRH